MRSINNNILTTLINILYDFDKKKVKKIFKNKDKTALYEYISEEFFNTHEYKELLSIVKFNKEDIIELIYGLLILINKNEDQSNDTINRSLELIKLASNHGFNWPNSTSCFRKVEEEYEELKKAVKNKNDNYILEEMGDLIFTLQCYAYIKNFDFKNILDAANDKFDKRFNKLIEIAKTKNVNLTKVSTKVKEQIWKQAKIEVKSNLS